MLRSSRLTLGLVVLMTITTGTARAQFGYYPGGYGGFGFGGWGGSTPQGDIARGLGAYAVGAGIYNQETAVANSINLDTVTRYNQYMFLSQQEANQREYARLAARQKRDSMTGEVLYQRFRDNPTKADIEHGDALNVILDQLTDPRIHKSALRLATTKISSDAIDDIPFAHASDAVVISLHKLTSNDWPIGLRDSRFESVRKGYRQAIDKALDEDSKGDLTPNTVAGVREAARRVWDALEESPPPEHFERVEAENYVKGLLGLSRMLDKPNVGKVIAEVQQVKTTSVGHLIAFMNSYNLRFGAASTDRERAVYRELYGILDDTRDRILKDVTPAEPVAVSAKHRPTDFFQGMHLDNVK